MRKAFNRLETVESQRRWLDRREADLKSVSREHPEPADSH